SRGMVTVAAPSRERVIVFAPSRAVSRAGALLPLAAAPMAAVDEVLAVGVEAAGGGATRACCAGARTTSAGTEGSGIRAVVSGLRYTCVPVMVSTGRALSSGRGKDGTRC